MKTKEDIPPGERWLAEVLARPGSMTQRRRRVVEGWAGGVDALVAAARAAGVHLLELTDDRGELLIVASRHPFRPLT